MSCKNLVSKTAKFAIFPLFSARGLCGVRARNPDGTSSYDPGKRGGMAAFFLVCELCLPWNYRASGPNLR